MGIWSLRVFMGDFSLDALDKVFGDRWLEESTLHYRCTP
jgi:hypothetical protein